ncbi:MAG: pilus assembly protein PilP [Pseudomonadales bacterium]|nr:pilus assembly protein PilP [Pseudomonadales bacterium]
MNKDNASRNLLLFIAFGVLAGCDSNSNLPELQAYVERTLSRPGGQIEPLPQFVSYQAFTYSAAGLRGPFDIPVRSRSPDTEAVKQVEPDLSRPKEALEEFAIGSLSMVGTVSRDGVVWALIRDETTRIHRVTVGNHLGKNYGRIVAASESQLDIVEIVPSGDGGWIERPQTISLQQ